MMQTPIAKSNVLRRLALGGVALAVTASTGCKTAPSLPGASLFGWKKTPSAETLAGQGPTTTYPSAPSTAFTPNAIASNAAGTGQESLSTSLNPSDIATGVPTTAAQSNGFTGLAPNGTPATGYAASGTASPAGYTATPPSYAQIPPTPSSAQSSNIPSYAAATQPAPARSTQGLYGNGPTSIPPGSASVPNYAPSNYTPTAPTAQVADATSSPSYGTGSYGTSGTPSYPTPASYGAPSATPAATPGYSTPNYSVPPTSPYSAPSSAPYTTPSTGSTSGTTSGYATPGYAAPTGYVTGNASATNPYAVPQATSTSASPTSSSATTPATGYRPGSTSNATSYPSTPYTTPSGSVYR